MDRKGTRRGLATITAVLLVTALPAQLFAGGQRQQAEPVLRIAQVMAEDSPLAGSMLDEFARALEEAIGVTVDARVIMEYGVGIEAMRGNRLDVMLVSPMSYYQALERAPIEPLVTTQGFGGVAYKSVFIARHDRDDINSLQDLRGKTFAFVDPGSSSGYVYPKVTLVRELGLDPARVEDPGYFFQTATYSGRHDASIMGLLMGDYDAAVVALALIPMMANAGAIDADDLKILAETPEIPNPLYIVRTDLDPDLKERVRAFYLGYENPDYFEAVYGNANLRYVTANRDDYQVIFDLVELLGITGE